MVNNLPASSLIDEMCPTQRCALTYKTEDKPKLTVTAVHLCGGRYDDEECELTKKKAMVRRISNLGSFDDMLKGSGSCVPQTHGTLFFYTEQEPPQQGPQTKKVTFTNPLVSE